MGPGPLERMFGSSMARLLDFFTTFENYDYSKTDIAEAAEVSIRTVIRAIPYLEEHEIIKHTRTIGKAEMYQLNKDSPAAQQLKKLAFAIATTDVDQEMRRQSCEKEEKLQKKAEAISA